MPVNCNEKIASKTLYQRKQYGNGGIGRLYWDLRDKEIMRSIPQKAQIVVDAGCGEGITLEKLIMCHPEKQFHGIDVMDENVRICRKLHLPVMQGDLNRLPLKNESVDCGILSEVIEHLPDHDTVIEEIRRVLRPGGRIIVVFPNDLTFFIARMAFMKFKEAFYDPGHLVQWTPSKIRNCLKTHGFSTERVMSVPFLLWNASLHGIALGRKV